MQPPPLPPTLADKEAQLIIGLQVLKAATPHGMTRSLEEIAWVTGWSVTALRRIYKDGLEKAKALLAVHNIKEIDET